MSVDSDELRRLADTVDALQDSPITVDGAQLLETSGDAIRGRLTVTVPADADLDELATERDLPREAERAAATLDEATDVEEDLEDDDDEVLDHTSTEDLQRAYDEADGNISAASDRFEVSYGTVYQRMKDHGVHETDDSSTSTEDDTTTPDSESPSEPQSEARNVDLEGDAADDAPAGTGDDVQDESSNDHTAEPITVDAADDQAETNVEFSEGVTQDDVEAAVDEHETLGDVAEALGVTRGRARTFTCYLGCYGDVRDVPGGGR